MSEKIRNIITAVLCLAFAVPAMAQTNSPSITSLQPASGPVGTQVTVMGTGFTSTDNTVKFGVGYIKNIVSNGTTIIFMVPDGLDLCLPSGGPCPGAFPRVSPGNYNISLVNANGTSNAVLFTVTATKEDEAYRKKIEDSANCGTKPGAPGNWICKDGGWKIEQLDVKAKRAELNNKIKDEREAAKKRIETVREEAKKATETRREELKNKIGKLQDEKKKQAATRLNEQMARLNTQWTNHFNNVLDQLSEILLKVELRAGKAETNGKDVVAVKTAIQNAKNAIATARTAVEAQAKKTYIATFSSETDLNAAFKTVREQLRKDLFGLRDGVMKSAREAVKNALQALKGVPKVDEEK